MTSVPKETEVYVQSANLNGENFIKNITINLQSRQWEALLINAQPRE